MEGSFRARSEVPWNYCGSTDLRGYRVGKSRTWKPLFCRVSPSSCFISPQSCPGDGLQADPVHMARETTRAEQSYMQTNYKVEITEPKSFTWGSFLEEERKFHMVKWDWVAVILQRGGSWLHPCKAQQECWSLALSMQPTTWTMWNLRGQAYHWSSTDLPSLGLHFLCPAS